MFEGVILTLEIFLAALLALLGYRMVVLTRTQAVAAEASPEPVPAPGSSPGPDQLLFTPRTTAFKAGTPTGGTELISRLCIIFSLQERDCREQGLHLATAQQQVRRYALAWLYGASCELCLPAMRHSSELKAMVAQIASKKLEMGEVSARQALETLTTSDVMLACFRNGLEGAQHWGRYRFVKTGNGIYSSITSNAFL